MMDITQLATPNLPLKTSKPVTYFSIYLSLLEYLLAKIPGCCTWLQESSANSIVFKPDAKRDVKILSCIP